MSQDAELESVRSLPAPTSDSVPSRRQVRERNLRADKLVEVLTPTLVRCLNCGATIKLSLKSEYDASHWLRHRTRCVKKSKARELGRTSMQSASSTASSSPTSSARALTPHDDDDDDEHPAIASTPALRSDIPIFHEWKSWSWSQVKSRFPLPKAV
ncbi:hypothetical protein DFH07DRAFT_393018 [Mycena maculata]|uniref:Uncharacterized protein n=1 Tax=Mycena maculata TaxID=230809 RepID=A0AAD7KB96_9AGAR|nr:hypothetical protein DFH07DRAFT_393018 [Mycena maculata]